MLATEARAELSHDVLTPSPDDAVGVASRAVEGDELAVARGMVLGMALGLTCLAGLGTLLWWVL